VSRVILFLAIVAAVLGQNRHENVVQRAIVEKAHDEKAYELLRAKDYDAAIEQFRQAIVLVPNRATLHTDFAYTLLKVGETNEARDEFGEAMRLDPSRGPRIRVPVLRN
jgi:Tfp pilus assembly protein PilF